MHLTSLCCTARSCWDRARGHFQCKQHRNTIILQVSLPKWKPKYEWNTHALSLKSVHWHKTWNTYWGTFSFNQSCQPCFHLYCILMYIEIKWTSSLEPYAYIMLSCSLYCFLASYWGFSGLIGWSFLGTQKSQIKMYQHCSFLEESDHTKATPKWSAWTSTQSIQRAYTNWIITLKYNVKSNITPP